MSLPDVAANVPRHRVTLPPTELAWQLRKLRFG